jgi:DNA-binding response OmpR family regulator
MITILIVDDEPHILELVRITLAGEQVTVLGAADGRTALASAGARGPDLIFLDVNLPDLSGFEVCRRLRDHLGYDGRIVMLTAAARAEDEARGLAAGADQYFTKPFSPMRLLELVEELLPEAVLWAP